MSSAVSLRVRFRVAAASRRARGRHRRVQRDRVDVGVAGQRAGLRSGQLDRERVDDVQLTDDVGRQRRRRRLARPPRLTPERNWTIASTERPGWRSASVAMRGSRVAEEPPAEDAGGRQPPTATHGACAVPLRPRGSARRKRAAPTSSASARRFRLSLSLPATSVSQSRSPARSKLAAGRSPVGDPWLCVPASRRVCPEQALVVNL